jgi:hypothetical protein
MRETLAERQAITLDYLIGMTMGDLDRLGTLIDVEVDRLAGQKGPKLNLVVTDAFGKRQQMVRGLTRLLGIESTIRFQNIQLNQTKNSVSLNGPVQIIVESDGAAKFDPTFGSVTVDSPSADEISSANG